MVEPTVVHVAQTNVGVLRPRWTTMTLKVFYTPRRSGKSDKVNKRFDTLFEKFNPGLNYYLNLFVRVGYWRITLLNFIPFPGPTWSKSCVNQQDKDP